MAAKTAQAGPPPLAPLGAPPIPPDNKNEPAKIELGKILFFDPRLGGDASTGCSTCHEPDQGWAWAEDLSRGYPGTVHWRNSQTIINSAYYGRNFWAGSVPSLEKQAPSAAKGGVAGNGENDIMESRLALIPEYRKRFQACLRPRDRFWDIPVPKIDSAFDNLLVPQPSWSPSTTQQLRKLVAAPYLAPNDWTPRSEAYFVFPLAQGTPGKQCGLAATGVYQPSLRSPWLAAKEVFGTDWPLIGDAWRAIAAFERTLVQRDTPLDKYLQGDKSALTEQQLRGMKLYNGKAGCIQCHNGELASDQDYYNIGVPPNKRWEEDGLAQVTFRFENYAKGQNEENYRTAKSDWGFYFRGKNQWDKGKFRTPSLRYTMYTAPYMHNGVFYTMEDVVDFYNRGGFDEDGRTTLFPETKSKLIKPLGLTDEEKEDLVAFLEAFSGEEIAMEKPKLPPYAPLFTKAELEAAQEAK